MTNMDKAGIGLAIGITAVALLAGLGLSGDELFGSIIMEQEKQPAPVIQEKQPAPVIQAKPPAPVIQEKPVTPFVPFKSPVASYASSDGNLIDQFDWSISAGDVKSMYLDKGSSSLIINTETSDNGELFVGLNADYIGSDDGTFFVLVDNQEHQDYEQAGMDLYIDLPAGAETVEIIGSYAIS